MKYILIIFLSMIFCFSACTQKNNPREDNVVFTESDAVTSVDIGAGEAIGVDEENRIPLEDNFIFVRGGTFIMGDGSGEDNPPHEVTVSDFYISAYQITFKEWKAFTDDALQEFRWESAMMLNPFDGEAGFHEWQDDLPMFNITWLQAIKYCNWLSEKRGRRPVYKITMSGRELLSIEWDRSANGYRLPTEAEWEYAAIGGELSRGYMHSGSNNVDEVAWHWGNSNRSAQPVGRKKPNELGIYDMTGNVTEWCWDFYDIYYYYLESPKKDPVGPSIGNAPGLIDPEFFPRERDTIHVRVIRGGSFRFNPNWGRSSVRARNGWPYNWRDIDIGFRLVRNAD
ncbi:MAG: formylglycine-generating enzyme family protein [Spirochaetaceae bacterium]|nr:formylglycine-generating enzyme family protein [Spirochaetaceae bacterium]